MVSNMQKGHGSPVSIYNDLDQMIGISGTPLAISGAVTVSPSASGTATTAQTTVSATAVLILPANASRLGATVANPAGPNTIYWGQTAGVTTATGFPIPPGSAYNIDTPNYLGNIYVITSGTGQLSATVELT